MQSKEEGDVASGSQGALPSGLPPALKSGAKLFYFFYQLGYNILK